MSPTWHINQLSAYSPFVSRAPLPDTDECLRRARARFPAVRFEGEALRRAIDERRGLDVHVSHPEDLCLALACASGDVRALAPLDREFIPRAMRFAVQVDPSAGLDAEVGQALRERLLVPGPRRAAHILTFDGSSPLSALLRVIARNCAVDILRARGHRATKGDSHLLQLVPPTTPELAFVQERFRAAFVDALAQAVQSLVAHQRVALRLHFADGVSLDGVARALNVHRATVARWIATGRVTLMERTRRNLARALGESYGEIDSILRAARSNLEISLGAVFRSAVTPRP